MIDVNTISAGKTFQVVKLEDTKGMLINDMHLDCRRLGEVVAKCYVAGHGGDVWFCEHTNGDIAAYMFTELSE